MEISKLITFIDLAIANEFMFKKKDNTVIFRVLNQVKIYPKD